MVIKINKTFEPGEQTQSSIKLLLFMSYGYGSSRTTLPCWLKMEERITYLYSSDVLIGNKTNSLRPINQSGISVIHKQFTRARTERHRQRSSNPKPICGQEKGSCLHGILFRTMKDDDRFIRAVPRCMKSPFRTNRTSFRSV